MKKDILNHTISNNDGYGQYSSCVASQANGAGTKHLYVVTEITIAQTNSYYTVVAKSETVYCGLSFELAKEAYNNVR